jgi:hypothetical protein
MNTKQKRHFWVKNTHILYQVLCDQARGTNDNQTSDNHSHFVLHTQNFCGLQVSLLGPLISTCCPVSWPGNKEVGLFEIEANWEQHKYKALASKNLELNKFSTLILLCYNRWTV